MPTVFADDRPINVETTGDDRRPALLLLNPLGTTIDVWEPLLATLASHNWVIRFDIRGHGRFAESTPIEPYSVDDLTRDAIAVLDALEVTEANVLGASLGGLVGLQLAASYPDRVGRLILAATAPVLGPDYWWDRTIETVQSGGIEAAADHLERVLFSEAFRTALPTRVAEQRAMLVSTPDASYVAGARAIQDANLGPVAAGIRASTLLISGEDDPVLAHHPPTDLLSAITDSEAVMVSGAGHRVLVEQAEVLGPLICDFLTDPDGR
ncbi:MAG: alpha/beta fold hydrolase [Acidimicrobiales bacterium]